MESQPQNPEFRNNPENFQQYKYAMRSHIWGYVLPDGAVVGTLNWLSLGGAGDLAPIKVELYKVTI